MHAVAHYTPFAAGTMDDDNLMGDIGVADDNEPFDLLDYEGALGDDDNILDINDDDINMLMGASEQQHQHQQQQQLLADSHSQSQTTNNFTNNNDLRPADKMIEKHHQSLLQGNVSLEDDDYLMGISNNENESFPTIGTVPADHCSPVPSHKNPNPNIDTEMMHSMQEQEQGNQNYQQQPRMFGYEQNRSSRERQLPRGPPLREERVSLPPFVYVSEEEREEQAYQQKLLQRQQQQQEQQNHQFFQQQQHSSPPQRPRGTMMQLNDVSNHSNHSHGNREYKSYTVPMVTPDSSESSQPRNFFHNNLSSPRTPRRSGSMTDGGVGFGPRAGRAPPQRSQSMDDAMGSMAGMGGMSMAGNGNGATVQEQYQQAFQKLARSMKRSSETRSQIQRVRASRGMGPPTRSFDPSDMQMSLMQSSLMTSHPSRGVGGEQDSALFPGGNRPPGVPSGQQYKPLQQAPFSSAAPSDLNDDFDRRGRWKSMGASKSFS